MVMDSVSWAQRTYFRTFEFDSRGSTRFGPPLVELDGYILVGRLIEITLADDVREMGENVRKANAGVEKHGI